MTRVTPSASTFRIARAQLTGRRAHAGSSIERLPFRLALLGLLLYLLISDNLLVSLGIPYNAPSGSFLFKLHPGTWPIALGFALLVLRGHPREHWRRLFAGRTWPLLLAGVTLITLVYVLIRFGPSGNAFFIDTLLMPALLAIILLQAPLESQRRVFRMVVVVLVVNALIGIGEALTQWRLTPYMQGDQPAIEDYFRATALSGHPLKNAMRTATLLIACLLLPNQLLLFLLPLLIIALLAFGGRAALVISLGLLGGWGVYHYFKAMVRRALDVRVFFGLIIVSLIVGAGTVALVATLELGQRILDNFAWDTSAQSRLVVYQVFNHISPGDLLLGIGPARIESLLELLQSSTILTDFENFWVLLLLQIGLAWFIPLTIALLGMIASLVWRAPAALKLSAVTFLLLASATPALASKSQDLAILVAILIGGAAEASLQPRLSAMPPLNNRSRRLTIPVLRNRR